MRILILTPCYPTEVSSGYAFVHARSKIYKEKGNDISVFVPHLNSCNGYFEGVEVEYGKPNAFHNKLKEFNADVVAIHAPYYLQLRHYLQNVNTPFVVWLHGVEGLFQTGYFPPYNLKSKVSLLKDPIRLFLLRCLLRKATAVVYVSNWLKRIVERNTLYRHPNTNVIPNPVDTNLFQFKLKRNDGHGVSVRGFGWKYGLDIAVSAYQSLPDQTLTLLGSGKMESQLRASAGKNIVFFTEAIKHAQMARFYDNYSYFVAPSRLEAQGVAMCEAMACGLPVVASNVGGIPEFVEDGVSGILVPHDNPAKLALAVRDLTKETEKFEKMSVKAREQAERMLSHDRIYKDESSVLEASTGCKKLFDMPAITLGETALEIEI